MADQTDADLLHDHTLVWMSHPACEEAAQWPRSFLTVNPDWTEIKEPNKSEKVKRALASNALVRPAADLIKESK